MLTDEHEPIPDCDCKRCAITERARLRAEITRLNAALRYEQHLAERVGTHGPGCEHWGPAHYECAVRALKAAEARAALAEQEGK